MYPRNAASPERIAVGPVVQISDGAVQTSGVSVKVKPQGASASAGGGTISYEEGIVGYVPTQSETDHTSFQVLAYKTGCIPAAVTVVTSAANVAGKVVPADASITASVFDESTAFPLKSADTGSTAVARTGADSDTLKTLSDQLDAKASQTSVDDLPTNSELATALAAADDAVLAAISALNNLSSAGAQAAAVAALTAYAVARTSDVPSAAANASQVRVELATELARLDASSSSISTSTITSLKAMVADGTITFEDLLKLLVADQVGKVTNAETSAPVVWDTTGTIARKTATNADEYGNRSGVVVDLE